MKPSVQIAQNMRFRLGVGGHWSAHDLELLLVTILGPSGWKVSSRLNQTASRPSMALQPIRNRSDSLKLWL